jgi:hypothetical protein
MVDALKPRIVPVIQGLFFINAGIWLVIAINTLLRMTLKYPDLILGYSIIGVLMLGNTAAMLLSGWGLDRFPRLAFPFGILVLLVNIPLTVTDEFGVSDLVTLLIDLALLGLMVVNRRLFSVNQQS